MTTKMIDPMQSDPPAHQEEDAQGRGPSGPESRTSSGMAGLRWRVRSALSARLLAMVNSQVENFARGRYFFRTR